MKAEIIAVGSELLTPDNIDTNSLYLTQRLNEAGCEVHLKTVVGDSRADIAGVLRAAMMRSDLIIFSGGAGPYGRRPHPGGRGSGPRAAAQHGRGDSRDLAPEICCPRLPHGESQ